jgi:hypothetical protein
MRNDYNYLLGRLELKTDPKSGLYIELVDYEHFDYIDDVLTEIFDIDYSFRTQENDQAPCYIYFEDKSPQVDIAKAVEAINKFHTLNGKEYLSPSEG